MCLHLIESFQLAFMFHTFDQIQLKFLRNDAMNFLYIFDK